MSWQHLSLTALWSLCQRVTPEAHTSSACITPICKANDLQAHLAQSSTTNYSMLVNSVSAGISTSDKVPLEKAIPL